MSRPGRDHTRFPELVAAIQALPPATLIFDGEVCIFDETVISQFEWRRHGKPPGVAPPPIFMAFDCLFPSGKDLRSHQLWTRRTALECLLTQATAVLPARHLSAHELDAWSEVLARGYDMLIRIIQSRLLPSPAKYWGMSAPAPWPSFCLERTLSFGVLRRGDRQALHPSGSCLRKLPPDDTSRVGQRHKTSARRLPMSLWTKQIVASGAQLPSSQYILTADRPVPRS